MHDREISPRSLRARVKNNFITQKVIARCLAVSNSQVSLAFNGKHPEIMQCIFSLCTDEWIKKNQGKPFWTAHTIGALSEERRLLALDRIKALNKVINFDDEDSLLGFSFYSGIIRSSVGFMAQNYWGLIENHEKFNNWKHLADSQIDHRFSIHDGYSLMVPIELMCNPFNLAVVDEDSNKSKGKNSSIQYDDLKKYGEDTLMKYPRIITMIDHCFYMSGFPDPLSEEEHKLKRVCQFHEGEIDNML